MNIISRMINWVSGRYIKTVNNESIIGAGNIEGGGGASKEYVDQQDQALSTRIDSNTNNKLDKATDDGEFLYSHSGTTQGTKGLEVGDTLSGSKTFVPSSYTIKKAMIELLFPIGSVRLNTGTNPGTYLDGTTWELYETGEKALYLDAVAGNDVEEELPNIKGTITKCYWGGTLIPQPAGAFSNSVTNDYDWQGQPTDTRKGMLTTLDFEASNSNSVYKDNGKVKVAGKTICAWVRTA